jgi:DNA-directed RNA polymerase subunit beta
MEDNTEIEIRESLDDVDDLTVNIEGYESKDDYDPVRKGVGDILAINQAQYSEPEVFDDDYYDDDDLGFDDDTEDVDDDTEDVDDDDDDVSDVSPVDDDSVLGGENGCSDLA